MKIGIDLRRIACGESDSLSRWLHGALSALFARAEAHTYVLFHTPFNYHFFSDLPTNVIRHTLSTKLYAHELQDKLTYEGDFDLLLRVYPVGVLDRFPLERQIVCIPDWQHETSPQSFAPEQLRAIRTAFNAYQTRGGAIAVPDETVRQQLLADPWTLINDVFIMPVRESEESPSWALAVAALATAFVRVNERAERHVIPIRVSTPPVVSIVTPSFNQGAFIHQTIESVLQQDYPHIDYRVIDGGSTDETVAILKSYEDRVQWVSEKDRGQAHAINKGMAQARGEIRTYLNSDDLLRPGAVSRVAQHFQERPACDFVYGRDALIDAEGQYIGMYPTEDYSFERLVDCCCISQPAAFWRKRVADRIGAFNESLHLVLDYDYWLRAGRAGVLFEHIPDVLAHTRIHRQAKSSGSGDASVHQRRYFRELFPVSIQHAGCISPRYVHAWLNNRLFNPHPWTRRYEEFIVRVCKRWYHLRCRGGLGHLGAAFTIVSEEAPRLEDVTRRAIRALNPRTWFRWAPLPLQFEPDLWIAADLKFSHPGGPIQLTGVPARDSVLRIFRGNTEVAAVPLQASVPTEVCVEVPAGQLRIIFSEAEVLPDGRRVGFKVLGTTLFKERDVA